MKIKENGTGFITGPYPKTRRRSPEKLTLGRKKPCSRVELLRARQALPLVPLAPPSLPGANGRSRSSRRGRKRRARSPESPSFKVLFGFDATASGRSRHHPQTNRGAPLHRSAEVPSSVVAGVAVAGVGRFLLLLPPSPRRESAIEPPLTGKRK